MMGPINNLVFQFTPSSITFCNVNRETWLFHGIKPLSSPVIPPLFFFSTNPSILLNCTKIQYNSQSTRIIYLFIL
uniref:Uncharacterized protein n=1 Tax=Rhizophora mucronata TaxID=61149 RepID=A0A2P2LYN7_RHIMU